ncbi:MAG: DUF2125 domain-containing protein [Pseudomonadota bacterium]|nr:DUF2125 domain-containing protein [Pseudomonadota bacterium]
MSSRAVQLLIATGSLLALLFGGYTVFWHLSVSGVQKGLERWASDHRERGSQVSLGRPTISGFPFVVRIHFERVDLAGQKNSWRWIAPQIVASVRPWNRNRISIKAPGMHTVKGFKNTKILKLEDANAYFQLRSGKLKTGVMRLAGITLTSPVSGSVTAQSLALEIKTDANIQTRTNISADNMALTIDVRGLSLPKASGLGLKEEISRLFVNAVVIGDIRFSDKLPGVLNRWREGGGSVEINTLGLDWDPLSLRANGTLALDETLQPQGAMSVEIEGLEPTLSALIEAGVIDARTAFAAKFANRTFAVGGSKVRLPLSVQKQRLYIGPVPVWRLGQIRWK